MAQGTCERCDQPILVGKRSDARYCSRHCTRTAAAQRARAEGRWTRVPEQPIALTCDTCGAEFQAIKPKVDQEHRYAYCSTDCEGRAKALRYRKECERHGHLGKRDCPECAMERDERAAKKAYRDMVQSMYENDPCAYCGHPDGGEFSAIGIDHITPESIGGEDEWTNWTACCRRCNGQKGTLPLLGYLLWRAVYPAKKLLDDELRSIQTLRP